MGLFPAATFTDGCGGFTSFFCLFTCGEWSPRFMCSPNAQNVMGNSDMPEQKPEKKVIPQRRGCWVRKWHKRPPSTAFGSAAPKLFICVRCCAQFECWAVAPADASVKARFTDSAPGKVHLWTARNKL